MRYLPILLSAMLSLTALTACKDGGEENPVNDNPYKIVELSTKSQAFVQKGQTFAFDFIQRINASAEGDYIISPLSMQFLLGMLLDGAQGDTADEISNVLGYGAGEVGAVNEYCLSMMKQLPALDKQTKLSIANAIVVNQDYPIIADYKKMVEKYYDAEVSNMDFNDIYGTASKINEWCSDKTNGLIPKILEKVDPSMFAYLMNALYFKSEWMEKFPAANTSTETFTRENGSSTTVQMMKNRESFLYQECDGFKAVSLPYGNGAYSMTAILPSKGKALEDIVATLTPESWDELNSAMVKCDVDLWLPKFETKFYIKLNDILSAMGMESAFNPLIADFKAMSDYALCLSFVQQHAVIKVDEKGTEAAAVSSAGMECTAVAPGEQVSFHADRPFLYLITETSTGAILFAGRFGGE